MKDSTVVCLQFPAGNEPVCLPGPADRAAWFGGRRRVSRDGDTVTVCAARWEWEQLMWVLETLKEETNG